MLKERSVVRLGLGASEVRFSVVLGVAICVLVCVTELQAVPITLGFQGITNNNVGSSDTQWGEQQLFVDVSNGGPSVEFKFYNEGPAQLVISEIYFDDGTLLGISSIDDSEAGVNFMLDASPPDLPGGDTLDPIFEVTAGFLAEPSNPAPANGVGPGESVTIMFALMAGGTLADVLAELNDGTLRIGIHVIDFASGGSESFVHLPEPASMVLLSLGSLALFKRRRKV